MACQGCVSTAVGGSALTAPFRCDTPPRSFGELWVVCFFLTLYVTCLLRTFLRGAIVNGHEIERMKNTAREKADDGKNRCSETDF